MSWTVVAVEQVQQWLASLEKDDYKRVMPVVEALRTQGPQLGTPYVKPIVTSQHANMKELRIAYGARCFRILFAFDPERQAILLAAAEKVAFGVDEFYERFVPIADALFSNHVKMIDQEKLREKKQEGGKRSKTKDRKKGK